MGKKSPKLAPGTIHTVNDQITWYREQFGDEKTAEQIKAEKFRRGACICEPVTKKVDGISRSVHSPECPKWKAWMGEDLR